MQERPPPSEPVPENWQSALAIVAHPDDLEYGAASAIAKWTGQGKRVVYVMVSRGEAGIDGMDPSEVGPLRMREEINSARVVGVDTIEFLDYPRRRNRVRRAVAPRFEPGDSQAQARRYTHHQPPPCSFSAGISTWRITAGLAWRCSTRRATLGTAGYSRSFWQRDTRRGTKCALWRCSVPLSRPTRLTCPTTGKPG